MMGVVSYGCWAGGDCAVRAMCSEADLDGAMMGDGSMMADTKPDTFIVPDGPLPDGTCNGGAEDCANGMDDNCNMLVDCADPVCQGAGYSCTDAPPAGWAGPLAYWDAVAMTRPSCAGNYTGAATDLMSGISAPPATCGCSCSGSGPEVCGNAPGGLWDGNGSCNVACPGAVSVQNGGACLPTGCNPATTIVSASFPKLAATGLTCNGNLAKMVPAVSWSTLARTCAFSLPSQEGGCGASKLCVTAPTSPFGGPCITQSGDLTCPNGYPTKHLQYAGANDTRGCTACTCNTTPGTCTGGITFYATNNCQMFVGQISLGTNCSAVSSQPVGSMAANGNFFLFPGGSCAANAVSPNGTATEAMPTTICCK
jgi:hypothetical protein